jgi:hypothetical protein
MKRLIKLIFTAAALTGTMVSCGGEDSPGNVEKKLELEADVATVEVGQPVTFTVTLDGEDITGQEIDGRKAQICTVDFGEGGLCLSDNVFIATESGTYIFNAYFPDDMGNKSNQVTITVTEVEETAVLELTVDKTTIRDNGVDAATFTVTYDEVNVTSTAAIKKDGAAFTGTVFTSSTDGVYEFTAEYDGKVSNAVIVSVETDAVPDPDANFDATKKPQKNVLYHIFTDDECTYCVVLKNHLKAISPDRIIPIYYYSEVSNVILRSDILTGYNSETSVLADKARIARDFRLEAQSGSNGRYPNIPYSNPQTIVEFDKLFAGSSSQSALTTDYNKYVAADARTGIKVVSMVEGDKVNFTVSVGAKQAGNYRVGAMLLENGIKSLQWTPEGKNNDYIHEAVFRDKATTAYGKGMGVFAAGDVKKLSELSFDLSAVNQRYEGPSVGWVTTPRYNRDNLYMVIYTVWKDGDNFRVANCVKAAINGTTDFQYE